MSEQNTRIGKPTLCMDVSTGVHSYEADQWGDVSCIHCGEAAPIGAVPPPLTQERATSPTAIAEQVHRWQTTPPVLAEGTAELARCTVEWSSGEALVKLIAAALTATATTARAQAFEEATELSESYKAWLRARVTAGDTPRGPHE